MDLAHDRGSVCTCHPVTYPSNTLHRLLTHGTDAYSAHYRHHRAMETTSSAFGKSSIDIQQYNSNMANAQKQNTTLQSVLLGEIPAEYSHLTSQQKSIRNATSPSIPPHQQSSPSLRIPMFHDSSISASSPRYIPSPHALASSPHSMTTSPSHTMAYPQHVPSPRHTPPSVSPHRHGSPIQIPAQVPSPYSSGSASSPYSTCSESCQDEPIDLSCKGSSQDDREGYSSGSESQKSDEGFSMLRNLLSIGKNIHRQEQNCDSDDQMSQDNNCGTISSTTRVTLAKKNMYPVSSRVSDWLVKIVQFAKAIPEFQSLSQNDKVTLILNSWTRLLILFMSESNFQFVVTPIHSSQASQEDAQQQATPTPDEPTMKSVEGIQNFICKCQNMNLDQKEYSFLRMAVLFNAGYVGLDRPDLIDQLNSLIQQLLQEHVRMSRPNDVMHYSRLLLCLPALYGINCKMIENLFCGHINGNMDLEVLLKEMLMNL